MPMHDFDDLFGNDPRTVSRGVELHELAVVFSGLDTLYLVAEYPHSDIFDQWIIYAPDLSDPHLYRGIPVREFLVGRGSLGYKLRVQQGDVRLFLTDHVDDNLRDQDKHGMGFMLQIGPMWLRQHGDEGADKLVAAIYEQLRAFGVQEPENYPLRLNRIDATMDVVGLPIKEFSADFWQRSWVGRARSKSFHVDPKTGCFSGLTVGTSDGAVRFKAYDKILRSIQTRSLQFWYSVWNISPEMLDDVDELFVTRFEWTFFSHRGKFTGMQYLSEFTDDGVRGLLNYATLRWGRLCRPNGGKNTSRWPTHPFWEQLRGWLAEAWNLDSAGTAKRNYHMTPDINQAYLNSATGWCAGLAARFGIDKGLDRPMHLYEALLLAQRGSRSVKDKANERFEVFTRQAGSKSDDE